MTSRISTFLAVTTAMAIGLVLTGTTSAHHNMSAIFDFNDRVTMTGKLSSMDWRNPHIELMVEAKDGNQTVMWKIEGPAPSFFRTRDVGKAEFEAAIGKTVTAEASRARDGSRWGLLRVINLPNGKSISACPQNC